MNLSKFVFYTLTANAPLLSIPLSSKAEINIKKDTTDEVEVTFRISAKTGIRSDMPKDIRFDPYGARSIHKELTGTI